MPLPDRDSEQFSGQEHEEYSRELTTDRLPEVMRRFMQVRPEDVGSGEWFNGVAQFWGEARQNKGIRMREAAVRSGLSLKTLRFLEGGYALKEEVEGDILPKYAQNGLGDPGLYDEFIRQFQNPNWHVGRDLRRHKGFIRRDRNP